MNQEKEIKKIEKLYDSRVASSKDAVVAAGQWGSKEFVPLICEEIGKKIKLSKNFKVIEFGCGSGVLGNWIDKQCDLYVGIDISFQMLKIFLKEVKQVKNPLLIKSIIDSVPFSDNIFDIVIINGVTMYINNEDLLKKTFDEMKRVAKKNCTIFIGENITTSNYYWEFSWFQKLSPMKQRLVIPYIKFRKWISKKNSKLAGKYVSVHKEISPDFIYKYFEKDGNIIQSNSAAYTIKEKILADKYKGNKRIDFLIKLG